MGLFRRRSSFDPAAFPLTVGDALLRMEEDAGGRIAAGDVAPLVTRQVLPMMPSDERIDLIAFATYRLGFDPASGQRPEFAEGLIATGDQCAYLAWVDGPPATTLPYDRIRDASLTTVQLDIGDVPGLEIEADLRWLLIFAPPCSSSQAVSTLAMRLTGAVRPTWGG